MNVNFVSENRRISPTADVRKQAWFSEALPHKLIGVTFRPK
jgi:hypothetical protein